MPYRNVQFPPCDRKGFAERMRETLGDDFGGVGRKPLHDQDGELVAAESRHQIVSLQEAGYPVREGTQELIADVVAATVVHQLEAVDVDQQQRDRAVASA